MPELLDNAIVRRETFGDARQDNAALHVGFGVDAAYVRPAGIAITSLLAHNPGTAFVFNVFANSIEVRDRELLERLAAGARTTIELYHVDARAFAALPRTAQYSPAMYNRLLLAGALRGRARRALYLDADVLCIAPIGELATAELGGTVSLVVADQELSATQSAALGLRGGRYFNSGVMLIDVDRWLERDVSSRCVRLLAQNPRFRWADQDALNTLLDGETQFGDSRWNVQCNLHGAMRDMPFDGTAPPPFLLPEGAALLHFTGRAKPWHRWCDHPLASVYHHQARDSLWRDCGLVEIPPSYHEMKLLSHCLLRERSRLRAAYWYVRYALERRRAKRKGLAL